MKINNKGFAITGILYGLLILFALLVASYLTILTARKNRLDNIIADIEAEYNENSYDNNNITYSLILNKGTGISKIYYKKSNDTTYNNSSNTVTINGIASNTIYYYYVETTSGYELSSCNSKSNYCTIEITSNKNISLFAQQKKSCVVNIYKVIDTIEILTTKTVTSGDTVTYSFTKPVNTYSSSYCTPAHSINVITNINTNTMNVTMSEVTSDLDCYITFISSSGNVIA